MVSPTNKHSVGEPISRTAKATSGQRRAPPAGRGGAWGILRLRPLLMSRGRWCNPPQVTRNDTIAGNDDHLSAPFRRAQRLRAARCMHHGRPPSNHDTAQDLGVMLAGGWGEGASNAHSPIRDNRSEAHWPPSSSSAASLQRCAARVLISCAFPCRGHDALAGCVWVAMGNGPRCCESILAERGAKGRGTKKT